MRKGENLVTIAQAKVLAKLGFAEPTVMHAFCLGEKYYLQSPAVIFHKSRENQILLLPTLDQAIDWIRRKYDIVIYDTTRPFVDPEYDYIIYSYSVKKCNVKRGWNFRENIGKSKQNKSSYVCKRQALWIALRYIKNHEKTVQSMHRHRSNKKTKKR